MSSENPTGTVGGYPMQDNSNMSVGGFPQPGTSIGGYPAQPTTENKTEQPTLPPTDTQMTQNINITQSHNNKQINNSLHEYFATILSIY